MPEEKVMVKFTRSCSPYLGGEKAKFGRVEAKKLVEKHKVAVYWTKEMEAAEQEAKAVKDGGEGEVDVDESNGDDGQTPGKGKAKGKGKAAEGADAPKSGGKKRRVRVDA